MKSTRPRRLTLPRLAVYVALAVVSAVNIFPIIWIVLMSLNPPDATFGSSMLVGLRPSAASYEKLLVSGYPGVGTIWPFLINSLTVALGATALCLLTGLFAAYALSRYRFAGRNAIGLGILATRMLPPVAMMIPLFLFLNAASLTDTQLGLILAYAAIGIPFTVWMLRGFLDETPKELEEAAMVDGCSRMGALLRVILPIVAPGVAVAAVFTFLLAWNDFALALLLTSQKAKTLPLVVLAFRTEDGTAWGAISAAVILAMLPPILFTLMAQEQLERGLAAGAVKG